MRRSDSKANGWMWRLKHVQLTVWRTGVTILGTAGWWCVAQDDLIGLSDEFGAGSGTASWQRVFQVEGWGADQLEVWDVNGVMPGHMRMVPYASSWYQDYRGVLAFKEVTGDFVATTEVEVSRRDGQPGAPMANYSLAGILVRQPRNVTPMTWTPGGEDYVFLSLGAASVPGTFQHEVKTTSNSVSTLFIEAGPGNRSEIRVARVGPYLIMLRRPPGGEWLVHRRYFRDDFPETLQVGMTVYSDYSTVSMMAPFVHNMTVITNGNPDLVADFDYYRFQRPVVPMPLQGAVLSDAAAVSNEELLSFLGDAADSGTGSVGSSGGGTDGTGGGSTGADSEAASTGGGSSGDGTTGGSGGGDTSSGGGSGNGDLTGGGSSGSGDPTGGESSGSGGPTGGGSSGSGVQTGGGNSGEGGDTDGTGTGTGTGTGIGTGPGGTGGLGGLNEILGWSVEIRKPKAGKRIRLVKGQLSKVAGRLVTGEPNRGEPGAETRGWIEVATGVEGAPLSNWIAATKSGKVTKKGIVRFVAKGVAMGAEPGAAVTVGARASTNFGVASSETGRVELTIR